MGNRLKLLLDTCSFIWLTCESEKLSENAREAIDTCRDILLSDVSVWEICTKWQTKKLGLPAPPRTWIEEQAAVWQLTRLPIRSGDCYRSTELPEVHRDPFDRLLVSQAIEGGLTLVTPDEWIHRYPVNVLW
ncbi:MAG: type II toxin-antitoxin system VapC family toxin [Myxococcales bacterium]|nr:type II toxin-antitoxin system VapC family toxin [Myxococcales bacterium]